MHYPRCGAVALATLAGDVLVCGGCEKSHALRLNHTSSVERFRPSVGSWELIEDMYSFHSFGSAVLVDDHVYVLGGRDVHGLTNAAERLNLKTGSWELLPLMPEPLIGCMVEYVQI
eukprot:UN0655